MSKNGEMVKIEMLSDARLWLSEQINSQMERLGYNPADYTALDLGFELPAGWPVDIDAQPTLGELIIIAKKLGFRIIINNLNLTPASTGEANKNEDVTG